jgi:hypothetical protein
MKYNGIYQVGDKYCFKKNIPASYYDWHCVYNHLRGEGFNVLYMTEDANPQESFWWIVFDDFTEAFDFQMKYMV